MQAFHLALICRETARLDMPAKVPVSLLRECGGVMDEYVSRRAVVESVSRHPFPTGNAEAGVAVLQESAEGWIDGLEGDSTGLGEALDTTLMLAKAHCLMDPKGEIYPTWDAWVNAMQVGSAVFAAATATGG